ncbi:MAG: hypothetical protein R2713_00860 [Ilumatobacteraceae bacterium]
MLHLVGPEHWDPATAVFAEDAQMTLGLVVAYVVVDVDLMADRPNTNYHVFSGTDPEAVYAPLDAGELPDGDWAYLAFASKKDPDNPHLCPPGHTNFQIMTLAPRGFEFWGVDTGPAEGGRYRRDQQYRDRKAEITERMLVAAERVLGPFRDHIVHLETATPLTHQRYTHASGGTSYGYEHSPGQSGPHRPAHRTEIEGLWVTGAGTVSAHGIAGAMSGGVICAGQILDRHLLIEVMLGAPLVDPAAIPADPPDFDPVLVSRGAKLRAMRTHRAVSTPWCPPTAERTSGTVTPMSGRSGTPRPVAVPGYVTGPAAATEATRLALAGVGDAATIVLVEGVSDQIAVEALARAEERTLASVAVVPIGERTASAASSTASGRAVRGGGCSACAMPARSTWSAVPGRCVAWRCPGSSVTPTSRTS